jgi:hypothetical protein
VRFFNLGLLTILPWVTYPAVADDSQLRPMTEQAVEAGCSRQVSVVTNASGGELQLICVAAQRAIKIFRQCGFEGLSAIRVKVTSTPPKFAGVDAFGSFDVEAETIQIVNTKAYRP